MPNKERVYFFLEAGCKSITNPSIGADAFLGMEDVAVNPDLSHVSGVEREFWKLENGVILPMNQAERNDRKLLLAANPILDITPFIKKAMDRLAKDKLDSLTFEKRKDDEKAELKHVGGRRLHYLVGACVLLSIATMICKMKGCF